MIAGQAAAKQIAASAKPHTDWHDTRPGIDETLALMRHFLMAAHVLGKFQALQGCE
jgi:hypothetical protein